MLVLMRRAHSKSFSASTFFSERKNVDIDSSTFQGTCRKPVSIDKPNAHATVDVRLLFYRSVLSTCKFLERL